MIDFSTTQCLLFPEIFTKPAVLQFDQRQSSSDGGAILLKAADRRYGLIDSLAGCLEDKRQAGKVDHSTRPVWGPIPFTRCCWIATRLRDLIWHRSPRCRALRTRSERSSSTAWARRWPRA